MSPRRPAAALALLVMGVICSACAPEVVGSGPGVPDDGIERPTVSEASGEPQDPERAERRRARRLAAALPGPGQVGGLAGFSTCLHESERCATTSLEARHESWAGASDWRGDAGAARWVSVTASSFAFAAGVRDEVSEAVRTCPPGEFGGTGSPQGLTPRPPTYVGARRRLAVEHRGFRGTWCAETSRSRDGQTCCDDHVLVVGRGHVVLTVSASSASLAGRIFEEYVDRLDRVVSPR